MFNFYIYDKMISKNGLGSLMETNKSVDNKIGSVSGTTIVMKDISLIKS